MLPYLAKFPALYNGALNNRPIQAFMRDGIGLVDSPKLSRIDLSAGLQKRGIAWATPATLQALPDQQREKAVVVVQDAFTSYFETQLVLDCLDFLQRLGFVPLVAPFVPNGKPLHVHGFLKAFQRTAEKNAASLQALARYGVPLIGIDPSMTLTYRSEYVKALGKDRAPKVQLMQEWLAGQKSPLQSTRPGLKNGEFKLLAHCTERTNAAPSVRDWQSVFAALGQSLVPVDVGCCGMAGTYGHETAMWQPPGASTC